MNTTTTTKTGLGIERKSLLFDKRDLADEGSIAFVK